MDPFEAFGDDSDDNDDDDDEGNNNEEKSAQNRDPSDGALVFHQGTELSLLHYVESQLNVHNHVDDDIDEQLLQQHHPPHRVLACIDQFCYERHWMMHIGPQKGDVLDGHLERAVEAFLQRQQQQNSDANKNKNRPFQLVELGTYCGYSAIRIAQKILSLLAESGITTTENHDTDRDVPQQLCQQLRILSVDISAPNQRVAKRLVALAGLESVVEFIHLEHSENDPMELSQSLRNKLLLLPIDTAADFVFLDHDKELYLSDLQQLERSKIIRQGTYVAADNVVFFQLDRYRAYMQNLAARGIVETRLEVGELEYVIDGERTSSTDSKLVDGIELTTYLADPPS